MQKCSWSNRGANGLGWAGKARGALDDAKTSARHVRCHKFEVNRVVARLVPLRKICDLARASTVEALLAMQQWRSQRHASLIQLTPAHA